MDIWPPYLFAFSFAVQAAVALIAMAVVAGVDAPKPASADLSGGRPLFEIARQPRFVAAAICGVVSYSMMNLLMTSAPLAMKMCGLGMSDSNFGIQWHIVAIYGPSFFTRSLIARLGEPPGRAPAGLAVSGSGYVERNPIELNRDCALGFCFVALSSREPVSTPGSRPGACFA